MENGFDVMWAWIDARGGYEAAEMFWDARFGKYSEVTRTDWAPGARNQHQRTKSPVPMTPALEAWFKADTQRAFEEAESEARQ